MTMMMTMMMMTSKQQLLSLKYLCMYFLIIYSSSLCSMFVLNPNPNPNPDYTKLYQIIALTTLLVLLFILFYYIGII